MDNRWPTRIREKNSNQSNYSLDEIAATAEGGISMGVRWRRVTEYDIECDKCYASETLYSGDSSGDTVVCSIPTAIKVAGYHRSHGLLLCDRCFKDFRERGDNE